MNRADRAVKMNNAGRPASARGSPPTTVPAKRVTSARAPTVAATAVARFMDSTPCTDSVTVAVRARPLGKAEGEVAMTFTPISVVISPGEKGEQRYHFDSVYDGSASQEQIYADLGAPILRKALEGFNGTIFAYGQTGSGKTFTMSGGESGGSGALGIVPQLGDELFFLVDQMLEQTPDTKFLLTVRFATRWARPCDCACTIL